jgi:hypothetical protein
VATDLAAGLKKSRFNGEARATGSAERFEGADPGDHTRIPCNERTAKLLLAATATYDRVGNRLGAHGSGHGQEDYQTAEIRLDLVSPVDDVGKSIEGRTFVGLSVLAEGNTRMIDAPCGD